MEDINRRLFVTAALAGVPGLALARFAPARSQDDPLYAYLIADTQRNLQIFRTQHGRRRAQAAHALAANAEALVVHGRDHLARFDRERRPYFTAQDAFASWPAARERLKRDFDLDVPAPSPRAFDGAARAVRMVGITGVATHLRPLLDLAADKLDDVTAPIVTPVRRRQYEVVAYYCDIFGDCPPAGGDHLNGHEVAALCWIAGIAIALLSALPDMNVVCGILGAILVGVCTFPA